MSKKSAKNFISLLAAMMLLSFFIPAAVKAASGTSRTVTSSQIRQSGALSAIQSALNEARYNASSSNPYTVTVESGSYSLTGCLKIYSNTTLDLTGVTLQRRTGVLVL